MAFQKRIELLEEVAKQADALYQLEIVQNDAEGAAEIMPDFERAILALREFDKRVGLRV